MKKSRTMHLSFMPKSKSARLLLTVVLCALFIASAAWAIAITYSTKTSASRFVEKYQSIEQSQYRSAHQS